MGSKKGIQLLLTENVDNLGIVGDVVRVRPGYARNFLLPHGMATEPTAGNVKRLAARRAEVERQLREKRAEQERLLAKLAGFELTMQRSANEEGTLFGSVTQHDIALALQAEGFNIVERDIRIGSPIKSLDSYDIPVQLASDLKTTIKLWVVSDKPAEKLQPAAADEKAAS
jgi:large subunit ribosomal protein L9